MADVGCAAQDVGQFGRRERGHSAGKGGIRSPEHGHDRTPGRQVRGPPRSIDADEAFKRSEEDRVASRTSHLGATRQMPDRQGTLIDQAKASLLACRGCESWLGSFRAAPPDRNGRGSAKAVIRVQAVPPIKIAPIQAKTCARSTTARRSATGRFVETAKRHNLDLIRQDT